MDWRKVLLGFAVVTSLGCSNSMSVDKVLFDRLRDQGPIALDPQNPYLAANLFLAKQTEQSPELKGFLNIAGTPSALAIEDHSFGPIQVQLYYSAEHRRYTLEQDNATWIISGPYPINDETLNKLSLTEPSAGAPLVELVTPPSERKNQASITKSSVSSVRTAPRPAAVPDKSASNATLPGNISTVPFKSPVVHVVEPRFPEPEMTGDAMGSISDEALARATMENRQLKKIISQYAKADAELSPGGDLVHYVTSAEETLSILARWYTLDASNAGRIARMNSVAQAKIAPGDTLIIPSYMIKNKARLTEEALQEMAQIK
jgi:hypothetical protein